MNDVIVQKLAKGAVVATALAVATPQLQAATEHQASISAQGEVACAEVHPATVTATTQSQPLVIHINRGIEEWDKKLEKEFQKLAALEVAGKLTAEQANRLELLNASRDELYNAPPVEDVLYQIRHDRLLERMQKVLCEYVEFKQATNSQR